MKTNSRRGVIIFGANDTAQLVHYYLKHDSAYRVAAFTVDQAYLREPRLEGLPVVPFETLAQKYPPNRFDCLMVMGPSDMNQFRIQKYQQAKSLGYRFVSYVSSKATRWKNVTVGENCFILEDNTLQPFVQIGNNVVLWSGNHVGHHSRIEDHCFIASHAVICGHVQIGAGTFVGVNATIRECVKVGAHNMIGANTYISKDTDAEAVYAASPTAKSSVPSSRVRL
jgi:sugar O-acyltransferase (sialic acid O-acetyltransferase NeuD family)